MDTTIIGLICIATGVGLMILPGLISDIIDSLKDDKKEEEDT